jgi:acyl carrier protein
LNTLKTLEPIFQNVFSDNSIRINRNTTANDILDWDSLTHMDLIVNIENSFNFKFSFKEIMEFENIGDMVDTINKHL